MNYDHYKLQTPEDEREEQEERTARLNAKLDRQIEALETAQDLADCLAMTGLSDY